jgi:Domain of unknown function (DUF5122) beta-propeller
MRNVVLALVLAAVAATAGGARAAILLSETTWGGPVSEVTNGIAAGSDGAAYLAGFTTSFDAFGQEQLFLVGFAPDGSLNWQRTWEGPDQFGNDQARGVAVAPDGSIYVTGSTQGVRGDVLLLKFLPDGTLVWQTRWDGGGTESGEGVAVAADGSVYVTGGTNSFGDSHLFVLKFDSAGTLLWQRIRAGAAGEGIAVGPDGSVHAAGVAGRPLGPFGADMVLLKLDPQGALVWQRAYTVGEIADARGGVAVGSDGSVYVAGGLQEVTSSGNAVNDTFITKFSPAGDLLYQRSYGGRDGDFPGGVVALADGTILVSGETASFGAGSDDAYLLHVDATGRGIECNLWGGTGIDHGDDVDVAPGGTIVVGATTSSPPPFTFADCPRRTGRLRGTVAAPDVALADATGTLAHPNGTVATPNGTSPGGGGIDAALLRLAP